MKNNLSSPPVQDTNRISDYGKQRRNMLKFFGVSAAVITIGSSCGDDNDDDNISNNAVNLGSGDFGVLNYAYALEQLEAAYYLRVTSNLSAISGLTAIESAYLVDIKDHEVAHREFFKAALGSNAIPALEVDFSSVNFADRTSVLSTAKAFEDLGVTAYNGAGKLLVDINFLALAGKIVSVEGRHAAIIADMLSPNTFANTTDAMGLDGARTPPQVLAIAAPFIKTKINASNLPTS